MLKYWSHTFSVRKSNQWETDNEEVFAEEEEEEDIYLTQKPQ